MHNMEIKNTEVTTFLEAQNHALIKEIELLRSIILDAGVTLTENIKWNGPNYCYENEDRITMKIQPPKNIQIIFHRGAKVKAQPGSKLVNEDFGMLIWKGNDRAIATFNNMLDIENGKENIQKIITAWIAATT